jgi:hypothetical protein
MMGRGSLATVGSALFLLAVEGICFAQQQPLCVPGTQVCARANGSGGVQAGGTAQGQVGPNGANANANGNANANANVNANANANARGNVNGNANSNVSANTNARGNANGNSNAGIITNANVITNARGNSNSNSNSNGNDSFEGYGRGVDSPRSSHSAPIRFGAGLDFCGTLKAGVYSGYKAGPCFAISFRTERVAFEMESQLLIGGTRHSIDWVFPMSFVIPLTSQWRGCSYASAGLPSV